MQSIVSEKKKEREENSLSEFKLMLEVMVNLPAFSENRHSVVCCCNYKG